MNRALKSRLRSRVIVTLASGESFDGILWEADRDVWVLRDARALGGGRDGATVGLDGEVVLLADQILYAQRP